MAVNRGKDFEQKIKEAFLKIPNVSVDRLHDQMTGYKVTSANICDFIVYKFPLEYYIECKSVHGNTLPFSNISDNQWKGLLEKAQIQGVHAGIICWWIDLDITYYIPISVLQIMRNINYKSINGKKDIPELLEKGYSILPIEGQKKRVFYDYDMTSFFEFFETSIMHELKFLLEVIT